MKNPATVYCTELGYQYRINKSENSNQGVCVIKEGEIEFDAWKFFVGEEGKEYSYCAKNGFEIVTLDDGKNSYSPLYGACIVNEKNEEFDLLSENKVIPITDLMNLKEKISENINIQINNFESNYDAKFKSSSTLPNSFDWTKKDGFDWMTNIKDQGMCGSCWAFAVVGAMEGKINILRNDPNFDVDLSEQYILSCSGAGSCDGGWPDESLNYIRDFGVTDESCFHYNGWSWIGIDRPCSDKCSTSDKRLWYIDEVGYIPYWTDDQLIKEYLIEKGPILVTLNMDGNFDSDKIYRCGDYIPSSYHAMVLVGYDDIGGYWILRNSWGTWFDIGYYKLGYGECAINPYLYIDINLENIETKYSNNYQNSVGDISGYLSDTYSKDNYYMTLTEDCGFLNCNGLDSNFEFSLTGIDDIQSIDLIVNHKGTDNDFEIYIGDGSYFEYYGDLPNDWMRMKYNVCNSPTDCQDYISSGKVKMKYYRPSCSFCNKDYIYLDLMELEVETLENEIPTTTTTISTTTTTKTTTTTNSPTTTSTTTTIVCVPKCLRMFRTQCIEWSSCDTITTSTTTSTTISQVTTSTTNTQQTTTTTICERKCTWWFRGICLRWQECQGTTTSTISTTTTTIQVTTTIPGTTTTTVCKRVCTKWLRMFCLNWEEVCE